jgi:hypothetical protein
VSLDSSSHPDLFFHFVLFTVPHGDFSDFGAIFCVAAGVSAIYAPEAVFFNAIELPGGITVKPCFEGLTAPSAEMLVVCDSRSTEHWIFGFVSFEFDIFLPSDTRFCSVRAHVPLPVCSSGGGKFADLTFSSQIYRPVK